MQTNGDLTKQLSVEDRLQIEVFSKFCDMVNKYMLSETCAALVSVLIFYIDLKSLLNLGIKVFKVLETRI
jgi:hypothetical protein